MRVRDGVSVDEGADDSMIDAGKPRAATAAVGDRTVDDFGQKPELRILVIGFLAVPI